MDEKTIFEGLKKYFKFNSFKSDLQKKAVIEVCQRKHDVFVSMPTGSGKSLCYQLPAILQEGKITIIFSPLLALIKDQIDHLLALKIRAASINSKVSSSQKEAIIADLKSTSPNIRILYITPEQAATSTFKTLYENLHRFNKIAYLVVDEAHCVSEWGHDFRPQYQRLGDLRENVDVPCIALTATANSEVIKDIITSLRLGKNYKTFKTSCFRDNLFYDVHYPNMLDDAYRHLRDFINECLNKKEEHDVKQSEKSCGIIYCRTREQTEVLMEKLNKLGIKALCYHAGLKTDERKVFQEKWQNGDVPVICATISFGMGVDKATVRFVVHWGSPKEPASFYQESGRAGRDGKPSRCRVYYNRSDSKAIEFHLAQDLGKAGNKENKKKRMEQAIKGFRNVLQFCENPTECRHKLFTDHFGEPPPECVDKCDFCVDKKKVQRKAEEFLTKSIQFNSKATTYSDVDYSDLYGEGRLGINKERDEYNNGDDSDDDNTYQQEEEVKAKKVANDFIQKQFALRKNHHEMSNDTIDKLFSKHARVKAAASSSSKVKGLTLATREQYVTRILDVLYDNYTKCQEDPVLDKKDVEDCSVDVEYEIFSTNTNMPMYRNAVAKMISNVKKFTEDEIVYEKLLTFEPKPGKYETLSDLFRNITKEQQLKKLESTKGNRDSVPVFKSARQALDEENNMNNSSQKRISLFFKKASEVLPESASRSEETETSSDSTGDMSGNNKRDFKSLFGDDSDDEKRSRKGNMHSEPSDNKEDKYDKSSRDKHKHKTNKKDDRTDYKHKKRSRSRDRQEDKKRIKDDDSPKRENSPNGDKMDESPEENYKDSYEDNAKENETTEESFIDPYLQTTKNNTCNADMSSGGGSEPDTSTDAWEKAKEVVLQQDRTNEIPFSFKNFKKASPKPVPPPPSTEEPSRKHEEPSQKPKPDFFGKSEESPHKTRDSQDKFHRHKNNQTKTTDITTLKYASQLLTDADLKKKQRLKKNEVGGLVVKLLTPAYADRRFESRDIFKSLARSISHALADKDETEITEYVQRFLEKNEEITSKTTL